MTAVTPDDRLVPASTEVSMQTKVPVHTTAILVIVCVSYFMVILDASIVFTGLPSIQAGMGFSLTGLAWVQDAYVLAFGGLLLLGSRAGDLVGRRRMFVLGLTLFSVASLLVSVAPGAWLLIAARALQGVGAAVLAPTSLSLLTANFAEGTEHTRAVAAYSAVAGIGASFGLVIGGVLTDLVSWRAGFFLNVPVGIAMIVLAPRYLTETTPARGRFDLTGAVLATLGMTAVVFGIIESGDAGWASPVTAAPLVAGGVMLVLLVLNEARAEQPIMPLRLFASRERTGAYLTRMLYLGAMIGFFFFTSQFLQDVLGFTALQAGLGFLPMTAVNFAVALAIPRLSHRFSSPAILTAGVAATLAGMAWLSRIDADSTYLTGVALPMLLIGIGQGLAFAPMTGSALAGVDLRDTGAASGLVNTFHQFGTALGLAVLVAVAAAGAPEGNTGALTQRVHAALTGGSAFLTIALILVVALIVPAHRVVPAHRPAAMASSGGLR